MHPDLEHLVALDRFDRAIEKSDKAVVGANKDLKDAGAAVVAAEALLEKLKGEVAAAKALQYEGERKAKRYRDRKASAENVLRSGAGDYEAAERQIVECDRILDELETDILEQMEILDGLRTRIGQTEQDIVDAKASLELQRKLTPEVEAEQEATRVKLVADRLVHWDALDRELQTRYDNLCRRKKRAVAPVSEGACGACMQMLAPQQKIELGRGRLLECDSCRRWVYLTPS